MSSEFKPLAPGTVVANRYVIEKCLGVGSAAMVYKARDQRLPRVTALKVLFPHIAKVNKSSARFKKEILYSYEINHDNVVRTYEYVEDPDQDIVAITMEYVNGGDLVGLIDGPEPLSMDAVFDVLCQLLQGVQAIHDKQIIHRDLKPENLLISKDGVLKIADFSVAWTETATRLTGHGGVVGSIAYISPEYIEKGILDHRADLYAVGVIGYEMLTGNAPFEGDNIVSILAARAKEETPDPRKTREDCPKELSRIICKALEPNPDRRYSTAEEMLADVERLRSTLSWSSDPDALQNAITSAWGDIGNRTTSVWQHARLMGYMHVSKKVLATIVLLCIACVMIAMPSIKEFTGLFFDDNAGANSLMLSGKKMRLATERKAQRELARREEEMKKQVELAKLEGEEEAKRLAAEAEEARKAAENENIKVLKEAEKRADEAAKQLEELKRLEVATKTDSKSPAKPVEEPAKLAKLNTTTPPRPEPIKEPSMEYKVKAALILKFLDHVTWPDEKASEFGNQLPLCIVGKDPFGKYLAKVARKAKTKSKKKISLLHLDARAGSREIKKCQAAFISGWEQENTNELVRKYHKKNVLTMTERLSAGIIHFFVVRGNVKFDVNTKEAKRAEIIIDPGLIKIARRG